MLRWVVGLWVVVGWTPKIRRAFWGTAERRYFSFPKEIGAVVVAISTVRLRRAYAPFCGSLETHVEVVAESVLQVDWLGEMDGEYRFEKRLVRLGK